MLLPDGLRLNVEMYGEGPPLLVLHGFTGSVETWRSFIPTWSQKYKVIAVDVVGHGKSDAPEAPYFYGLIKTVIDLKTILDFMEIEKVNLLGYSMGGRLALTLAADYPERVNALLLESGTPGLTTFKERGERMEKDDALADDIEKHGIKAFVRRWEKIPLFSSQQSLPADIRADLRNQRLNNREVGLANSLRGMGTGQQHPVWNKLNKLDFPVLLVVGEWDRKFTKIAESMKERLPYAKIKQISEAGHAVHVEQPQMFGKIVMNDFYHYAKGMK
jgi:2-succinyl-6-hydroxy-2,4-cyclohexadiene-1-carboxylate synthase